jgi:hypothetical protein
VNIRIVADGAIGVSRVTSVSGTEKFRRSKWTKISSKRLARRLYWKQLKRI